MCGIFGVIANKTSTLKQSYPSLLRNLFLLSESRGKEASGFALNNGKELRFLKTPFSASDLVKSKVFEKEINQLINKDNDFFTAIGHSRLVTNGYEQYNDHNQPVIKNKMAVVHNGIIVNADHLWQKFPDENKQTDLDSELIPTLLHRFYHQTRSLHKSISYLYKEIYGMTSIAVLSGELDNMILATNNGSLYFVKANDNNSFIFASERYILSSLISKLHLQEIFSEENIKQLFADHACLIRFQDVSIEEKSLKENLADFSNLLRNEKKIRILEINEKVSNRPVYINTSMEYSEVRIPVKFTDQVEKRRLKIAELKRCAKCILPETFPFIEFDNKGVCNYCNKYRPLKFKGLDKFKELLDQYRFKDNSPNCLMPFSGGRDSSFALHIVKKELGMNPIAFSYDWGMLTDLARRNQSRMCGNLVWNIFLFQPTSAKKERTFEKMS